MQQVKLSPEDSSVIQGRYGNEESFFRILDALLKGGHFTPLTQACSVNHGIVQLSIEEQNQFVQLFEEQKKDYELASFVPASGAASRMFQDLREGNENAAEYKRFSDHHTLFPFINAWREQVKEWPSNQPLPFRFLDETLLSQGLQLAMKPKGSVPFHQYENEIRTAFQEHVHEAIHFLEGRTGVHIHFTVASNFSVNDRNSLRSYAMEIGARRGKVVTVSFSHQYPNTDVPALTEEGEPLRDEHGNIVFRPGGHGSLLSNLNQLYADLVFIKNIDNVVREGKNELVFFTRKMLGGYLMNLLHQRNKLISALRKGDEEASLEAQKFVLKHFGFEPEVPEVFEVLNRPLRVCGMVRNEGEPGGGPFWVRNKEGRTTVQIVEKAQIDCNDAEQQKILDESTYFNPVDIVCSFRNEEGEVYDLSAFADNDLAFVTNKKHNGKTIRVYEHPGLWNGSMAGWNSVFVEISKEVFAPVKTVNDLLRPAHQK
ncbi:MAG: hypothetical protein RL226_2147 [Bacteroidota bacterium]